MRNKYKIILIAIVVIFSILFVPPNVAAFSCNTLKIKDINCHVVGMTFFGIPFPTSIYHWFEWNEPIGCGGAIAIPEILYTCQGFADFWGYPAIISKYSDSSYHERLKSLNAIQDSSIPVVSMNIDEDSNVLMIYMTEKNVNKYNQTIEDLINIPYDIVIQNVIIHEDLDVKELEGVIIDQRLGKESHEYHFFTNELSKIDTGSSGIQLDGIDHRDDLDGKYVKLSGTISKKGEEIINVDKVQVLYSIVPVGTPPENMIMLASIDEIHENPDKFYNQMIAIRGELREHDADVMVHTGVGCDNAKFTTSEKFVSEFVSSQLLYDDKGDRHLGVRIGSEDNIGISKSERLPVELKNNQVEITGIFVPTIKEMNWCNAIIYKSGYILTDFEKVNLVELE